MAKAAFEAGADSLGLSCHSHVEFDRYGGIALERIPEFQAEIHRLRELYAPKGLEIFTGIEQDAYSKKVSKSEGYDYIIGSMHYLLVNGEYVTIDAKHNFAENLDKYFSGDALSMTLQYFDNMCSLYERTDCDIVGHFDVITKFNEGGCLFDERDPKYETAAQLAIEKLVKKGLIFEINTGCMARGYRSVPFPSARFLCMIRELGGKVTYSSDSHNTDSILASFEQAKKLALKCGFDHFMKLKRTPDDCVFTPVEID